MSTRKKVLHYRNGSGVTAPVADNIESGELAMTYTADHETLYIKNSANIVMPFSADHIIETKQNSQDAKVSNAVGLVINTSTGSVNYQYQPENELLTECTTMNDSVETLAAQVQNCLTLIEEMKQNVYMLDLHFQVEPNTAITSYNVSYQVTNGDVPTNPKTAIVTKYVNDSTTGTVIINNTTQTSGATTTNITGAKEHYVLEVEPNLTGALKARSEIIRYLCFGGASAESTMTPAIITGFTRCIGDGQTFSVDITTADNQYVWLAVPQQLQVLYATSKGITMPLYDTTQTVSTTYGTYTVYRSNKLLMTATWNVIVHTRQ